MIKKVFFVSSLLLSGPLFAPFDFSCCTKRGDDITNFLDSLTEEKLGKLLADNKTVIVSRTTRSSSIDDGTEKEEKLSVKTYDSREAKPRRKKHHRRRRSRINYSDLDVASRGIVAAMAEIDASEIIKDDGTTRERILSESVVVINPEDAREK